MLLVLHQPVARLVKPEQQQERRIPPQHLRSPHRNSVETMGVRTLRETIQKALPVIILVGLLSSVAMGQGREGYPNDALRRGNEQYAKANYQLAIEQYRRVPSSAGQNYAKALYNTGVCYYELWKTEDALAYYQRAIEARNGAYPEAQHALGVALKDLGRLREARTALAQSLVSSNGNYGPAHYTLGLLAMDQADYEGAALSFRNAIARFKSRFPAAHNNFGVALARMNRLAEAKLEFEIALSQAEGDFVEATKNLELCNSLLALPTRPIAALKVVEGAGILVR
ncbi:MAG TPA: tetratricopeptide repeat protein [Pyrinomonadaceae bacterium]|nr:tetratricopeptide repeat protein [Pyrinomonadaceae bacterium]